MRNNSRIVVSLVFAGSMLIGIAHAQSCSGVLNDNQAKGFETFFSPTYSPSLSTNGGPVTNATVVKRLSQDDMKRLSKKIPIVVQKVQLSDQNATDLKGWLNDNATTGVPGWVSTVAGIVAPSAWAGVSVDALFQLINGAGDAGQLTAANIAGTVSQGGWVGVTEQVNKTNSGDTKFVWTYLYQATLNGKLVTSPLRACSVDVVVLAVTQRKDCSDYYPLPDDYPNWKNCNRAGSSSQCGGPEQCACLKSQRLVTFKCDQGTYQQCYGERGNGCRGY
jgi:hypothetical protein